MTSPEVDLLEGLAQTLDTAGVATYSDGTAYAAGEVGVVFGGYTDDPTQQVVLTTYTVQDDPKLNDTLVGVQVMIRGTADPRSVKNLSGLIFDQFQGLEGRWFGSIFLAQMWRQSARLDGRDDNQRWLSAENYYARCNWPTQYRTE